MKCEKCEFYLQKMKTRNWFVGELVSYCTRSGKNIECYCGGAKNFCDLKEDEQ